MKKILFILLTLFSTAVAVAQQQTPKPEIYVDDETDVCYVEAYGEGVVHLFKDSVEVENPCQIDKDYFEQSFLFGAYAEAEGCYPSEWVYCEVIVPPIEGPVLPVEPVRGLNITVMDEYVLIEPYIHDEDYSTGTVVINGELYNPPYMLPRYNYDYEYDICVEFHAEGLPILTYEDVVFVPALDPIPTYEPDYGVNVTITDESVILEPYFYPSNPIFENFTLRFYIEGDEVEYPYTLSRYDGEDYEVSVSLHVDIDEGQEYSYDYKADILIPALEPEPPIIPPTYLPVITVEKGSEAWIVRASGDGEVHLFLDDVEVENPYTIWLTDEEQAYGFGAYLQVEGYEPGDWVYLAVEVPALEPVLPVDPDMGVHVTLTEESVILEPYVDPAYFDNCTYVIRLYLDGVEVEYPYMLPRCQEEYIVCATVQIDVEGSGQPFVRYLDIIVPALETAPTQNKYDVNGDGEVNIADINAIIHYILGN